MKKIIFQIQIKINKKLQKGLILLKNKLSKRIKELGTVGECLLPIHLIWFVIYLIQPLKLSLAFKIITFFISLGMAIGCNREKEWGIKCAYILRWFEFIATTLIFITFILGANVYTFDVIDVILFITLSIDLKKIEKLKQEKQDE